MVISTVIGVGFVVLSGIAALVILLGTVGMPQPRVTPSVSPPDPYAVYLQNAPAGAPYLSPADAYARAWMSCDFTYDPGTIGAALALAYPDVCWRK